MIKTKYKKLLTSFIGGISRPPVFDKLVQWLNIVDGTNWLDGSGVREGIIQNTSINLNGTDNQIEPQNTGEDLNFEDGDFRIEYWGDLSTPSSDESLCSDYDLASNNRKWAIIKRFDGEVWFSNSNDGTTVQNIVIPRINIPESVGKIEISRIGSTVTVLINNASVDYTGDIYPSIHTSTGNSLIIGGFFGTDVWNATGAFNRARVWCGKCDKTLDIIPIQEAGNTSTSVYDHSGNGYHGILSGTINGSTRTNYLSAEIPVYANELGYNIGTGEIIPPDPTNEGFDVLGNHLLVSGKVSNHSAIKGTSSLYFNGSNNFYTSSANGVSGNNARTIIFSITPSLIQSGKAVLGYGGTATGTKYDIAMSNNQVRVEIQGGAVVGTMQLNAGEQYWVAIVFNGGPISNTEIYINGVLDPLSATSSTIVNTTESNVRIGRGVTNTFFNGVVNEVYMWDSILDLTDIIGVSNGELSALSLTDNQVMAYTHSSTRAGSDYPYVYDNITNDSSTIFGTIDSATWIENNTKKQYNRLIGCDVYKNDLDEYSYLPIGAAQPDANYVFQYTAPALGENVGGLNGSEHYIEMPSSPQIYQAGERMVEEALAEWGMVIENPFFETDGTPKQLTYDLLQSTDYEQVRMYFLSLIDKDPILDETLLYSEPITGADYNKVIDFIKSKSLALVDEDGSVVTDSDGEYILEAN